MWKANSLTHFNSLYLTHLHLNTRSIINTPVLLASMSLLLGSWKYLLGPLEFHLFDLKKFFWKVLLTFQFHLLFTSVIMFYSYAVLFPCDKFGFVNAIINPWGVYNLAPLSLSPQCLT